MLDDAELTQPPAPTCSATVEGASRKFPIADIFTWLGGLLMLVAVTWAVALMWDERGAGGALAAVSVAIVVMMLVRIWADRRDQKLASDLLFTGILAGSLTWVLILFDWTDAWFRPSPDQGRFADLLTDGIAPFGLLMIALGVAAMLNNRFTLVPLPVILGMLVVALAGVEAFFDGDISEHWILLLGLVWFALGWTLDLAGRRAQAFWLHLAALLTTLDVLAWEWWIPPRVAITLVAALVFLLVAVLLGRILYLAAAVIAVHACVVWVVVEYFEGSVLGPVALFLVGISFLAVGLKLTLDRGRFEAALLERLPPQLVELGARPDR